mmetsp:Transcript_128346/g.222520  ORF Transcript_128346/g.222520 Transcript_128346/m.222520 type:complete len:82 (+) Transcript_128346:1-246(+)
MAILSLLDISMFLACYLDNEWKVLKLLGWSPDCNLQEIFITHPKKTVCKRVEGSCGWVSKDFSILCEEMSDDTTSYFPIGS